MQHIQIDTQRRPQNTRTHRGTRPVRHPAARQPSRPPQHRTPHCPRHPGVHMVLAGTNAAWNTIRYLCPLCNAMGHPPLEIATGVVSAWFADRGYGFIDNGGPRIFFHISDLADTFTPYVGMPVTCQVQENDRGLIGIQVARR